MRSRKSYLSRTDVPPSTDSQFFEPNFARRSAFCHLVIDSGHQKLLRRWRHRDRAGKRSSKHGYPLSILCASIGQDWPNGRIGPEIVNSAAASDLPQALQRSHSQAKWTACTHSPEAAVYRHAPTIPPESTPVESPLHPPPGDFCGGCDGRPWARSASTRAPSGAYRDARPCSDSGRCPTGEFGRARPNSEGVSAPPRAQGRPSQRSRSEP
jgi:hypothetical protein